jgi:hypothetical protein
MKMEYVILIAGIAVLFIFSGGKFKDSSYRRSWEGKLIEQHPEWINP